MQVGNDRIDALRELETRRQQLLTAASDPTCDGAAHDEIRDLLEQIERQMDRVQRDLDFFRASQPC